MKKKSIIEQIFYGNRGQSDTVRVSEEYDKIRDKVIELCGDLEQTLTEKQKEIFEKHNLERIGLEDETALAYFAEGLKIGIRIGIECMEE